LREEGIGVKEIPKFLKNESMTIDLAETHQDDTPL